MNRTWAQWEDDGATGPLDLPHYEAIGTMAQALDQHAEEAYALLKTERKQKICEKLFKALTDKGTDARGIRRPTKLERLCALAGATQEEVVEVIDVFRDPSRSFMMPPAGEALEAETVIDISHESLMRVWERLKRWANEEAQSSQTYRRLTETAALYTAGRASLWRDPDLQLALDWRAREAPTAAWSAQYGGGHAAAMGFLDESEALRAQELREKEKRQRQMRLLALIMAVLAVLAGALAVWGWNSSIQANEARESAEEQRRQAVVSDSLAQIAAEEAILAQKDAEEQRLLADSTARVAMASDSLAQVAAEEARAQTRLADSRRLATQADNLLDSQLDRGLLLSIEAYRTANTFEARSIELAALQDNPELDFIFQGHEDVVRSMAFSPDGKTLASGSYDGTVILGRSGKIIVHT